MENNAPFQIKETSQYVIVKINEEITIDLNDKFSSLLKDLEEKSKDVIIDFSKIDFISSTGFGVIARTHQNLEIEGKKLYILAPSKSIMRLLKIINFDSVISIINSLDEYHRA